MACLYPLPSLFVCAFVLAPLGSVLCFWLAGDPREGGQLKEGWAASVDRNLKSHTGHFRTPDLQPLRDIGELGSCQSGEGCVCVVWL